MTHHSEPAREAVAFNHCILKAMAENYAGGHYWDHLDSKACLGAFNEIERLRAMLSASPAPAAGGLEAVRELGLRALPDEIADRMEREARSLANLWANGDDAVRRAALALQLRTHIAALASPAATSAPTYAVNCCNCGRIIDTREESEGGDQWGHELSDDRWVCSPECLDAVTDPDASPAATRGEPVAWFCGGCGETDPSKRCLGCLHGLDHPAPAESAQVKVKPLEWVKHPSANIWRAECLLGVYQLYNIQTPVWLFDGFTDRVHDKRADSVDAGFAAAQADFEARIRASLATDAEG